MEDSVPTEDDIKWTVKRLRNHCSGVPSGMRAEHLKRWLTEARNVEKEDMTVGEETKEGKESTESTEPTEPTETANWDRLVDLVQMAFREGILAEEAT